MIYRTMCIAILSLISCEAAANEGIDFFKKLQSAPLDAIVQYCQESSPSTKVTLKDSYSAYIKIQDEAFSVWFEKYPIRKQEMEGASPEDITNLERQFQVIIDKLMNGVKQYEPNQYCTFLDNKLKTTTVEVILKSLDEYDERVKASKAQLQKS